jgi:hypothetical protein
MESLQLGWKPLASKRGSESRQHEWHGDHLLLTHQRLRFLPLAVGGGDPPEKRQLLGGIEGSPGCSRLEKIPWDSNNVSAPCRASSGCGLPAEAMRGERRKEEF